MWFYTWHVYSYHLIYKRLDSHFFITGSGNKEGTCPTLTPPYGTILTGCTDECSTDNQCDGSRKCCNYQINRWIVFHCHTCYLHVYDVFKNASHFTFTFFMFLIIANKKLMYFLFQYMPRGRMCRPRGVVWVLIQGETILDWWILQS